MSTSGNYANSVLGSALGTVISTDTTASSLLGVANQQRTLFPNDNEFLIAVTDAVNGRVVRVAKGQGYLAKTWVVGKDDDLVATIAAAIVAMKLEHAK